MSNPLWPFVAYGLFAMLLLWVSDKLPDGSDAQRLALAGALFSLFLGSITASYLALEYLGST